MGGSITGEHGVGMEKRDFMPEMYDATSMEMMAEVRRAMDPDWIANPGKMFPERSVAVECWLASVGAVSAVNSDALKPKSAEELADHVKSQDRIRSWQIKPSSPSRFEEVRWVSLSRCRND